MLGRQIFFLISNSFKTQEMCIWVIKEAHGDYTMSLIGLWYYKKCGVKTLIIMIILLGGAMHIKNKRLKKPQ